MELSIFSHPPVFPTSKRLSRSVVTEHSKTFGFRRANHLTGNCRFNSRRSAFNDVSAVTADPVQLQVTWQIVVGAFAGVTPFVVAGFEFGKRIVAQRRCGGCGGSGLVLRDKDYIRCPDCGGFLPWQSWKRFFSG